MRVTDRMNYNQVNRNLQKNRADMAELQNQAATQKKVTKPSDDPIASARVLALRTDDRSYQQFIKNMHHARSFLEATDTTLGELSDLLMRLKELALQQASDASATSESRRAVAEEVGQSFSQAIQIGNRKLGERYIFGGQKTTQAPFTPHGDYQGDDHDIKVQIHKDSFLTANLPGNRVFLGEGLGLDGLVKKKAEAPTQAEELPQYKEEEKRLQKSEYPDVSVQIRGPASVKEKSFAWKSEESSSVLPSSSSSLTHTNILKAIKNFEIALRVNDKKEIQQALEQFDGAISQVTQSRAQVGARLQTLSMNFDSMQKVLVDNKTTASWLEDADLFQVVSDMNKTEATLKATLETSGRLVQPSLLDFLK
jgi:flagellar hook-associated protein 3 FlgL